MQERRQGGLGRRGSSAGIGGELAGPARRMEFRGRRALIVETEPGSRKMCQEALEACGFTVTTAESGVAGLNAARQQAPDVILMDLQLRDALGHELIGWLRCHPALQATPIIAISAIAEDLRTLRKDGVAGLLNKPLSAAAIRDAVQRVLK